MRLAVAVSPRLFRIAPLSAALAINLAAFGQTKPASAPTSQPASSAPVAKDLPKAEDIIKGAMEAMGGKKTFDAQKSMSIKATVSTPMGDMDMQMKSAKPSNFYILQNLPGMGETTMGSDGKVGWMNNPMMGGYQLMEDAQLKMMSRQSNMFHVVFSIQEDFPTMETVDRVKFNDTDCYKVKMTSKDPEVPAQFGFFDAEKKLMQGVEVTQEGMGGPQTVSISFSEWKKIDDLLLFTKMTMSQAGMDIGMTFTEVEFNKVEPSAFDLPAEVKDLVKKKSDAAASQPASAPAAKPDGH